MMCVCEEGGKGGRGGGGKGEGDDKEKESCLCWRALRRAPRAEGPASGPRALPTVLRRDIAAGNPYSTLLPLIDRFSFPP